jgi:hypothetical protein
MAKATPTLEDVPTVAAQGERPIAAYNPGVLTPGVQALVQGGQRVGAAAEKVGEDVFSVEQERARNQALTVQDNALGEAIGLREKYKHDTDYATLPQRYGEDLDKIREKHLATIPAGPLREHVNARMQIPFAREQASVAEQAFSSAKNDWRAGIVNEGDQLINTTGPQDDPLHTAKMEQWGQKVHLGREKGYLTPVEAQQLLQKTSNGVINAEYLSRFRAGRTEAAKAVGELIVAQSGAGIGGMARLVAGAETGDNTLGPKALGNISRDSKGSKSYGFTGLNSLPGGSLYTFTRDFGAKFGLTAPPGTAAFDAQWKAAANDRPDDFRAAQLKYFHDHNIVPIAGSLEQLGIPADVAADPRVLTYFADRHVQMGNIGLQTAAPAAWANAGGDPAKFLRNMNQIDGTPEALQAHFPSAIATGVYGPRGHATRLNSRLTGALAAQAEPDQEQTGIPAFDILHPKQRDSLIREGQQILKAYTADDERQLREQEKERKAQALAIEDEYLKDAYSDKPQKTTVDAATDPRLANDPETKKKIIAIIDRTNKPDPIAPISRETTRQFIEQMGLPYGDPNKLTAMEPIKDAFIAGKLSRSDYDWLDNKFKSSLTPEGEKWDKHLSGVEKAVMPKITKTEIALGGIIDT